MFKQFYAATTILGAFFFSSIPAVASISPTEFVINTTTKQCGLFTQGDEYVQRELPIGWAPVLPEVNYDERIKNTNTYVTPAGTCVIMAGRDIDEQFADCCSQIRYAYISRAIPSMIIKPGQLTNKIEPTSLETPLTVEAPTTSISGVALALLTAGVLVGGAFYMYGKKKLL